MVLFVKIISGMLASANGLRVSADLGIDEPIIQNVRLTEPNSQSGQLIQAVHEGNQTVPHMSLQPLTPELTVRHQEAYPTDGKLGLRVQQDRHDGGPVRITGIDENSWASDCLQLHECIGLRLLKINGSRYIQSLDHLNTICADLNAGDHVEFVFEPETIVIKTSRQFAFSAFDAVFEDNQGFVKLKSVDETFANVHMKGLDACEGYILLEVNSEPVKTVADVMNRVRSAFDDSAKEASLLTVEFVFAKPKSVWQEIPTSVRALMSGLRPLNKKNGNETTPDSNDDEDTQLPDCGSNLALVN